MVADELGKIDVQAKAKPGGDPTGGMQPALCRDLPRPPASGARLARVEDALPSRRSPDRAGAIGAVADELGEIDVQAGARPGGDPTGGMQPAFCRDLPRPPASGARLARVEGALPSRTLAGRS